MTNTVKIEVEISLEDFFNSENDRAQCFQNAMQSAIQNKLNDNQWVQSNIAYYLFERFTTDVFKSEFDKISDAIRNKIEDFKEPSDYTVRSNEIYLSALHDALNAIKPEIETATIKKAMQFIEDDSTDYDSFYGRVADAMVDRVMDNFVNAMVDKKISSK